MPEETWLPVLGYEGLYEVSDLGRVRGVRRVVLNRGGRLPHTQLTRARLKAPWAGGRYPLVRLSKEGKKKTSCVHQLVGAAFLGPRPSPRHGVCHKDGDRSNNSANNLYWGTQTDNMADAIRHGATARGERSGSAKLTRAAADDIRRLKLSGAKLKDIAKKFGVSKSNVSLIIRGTTWK